MTETGPINHAIDRETQLCVSMSARPSNIGTRFHNYLYRALGLNFVYKAFAPVDIVAAIQGVRGLPIRGAAISMPFKELVIPLVDELHPTASAIGAVNTIVNTAGRLAAYNTDFQAVRDLLSSAALPSSYGVAVLGSGGMAKACVAAVSQLGFANCTVVSRNSETGTSLARQYGARHSTKPIKADVIINATPIGMAGGAQADDLPLAAELALAAELVMDVIAMPAETALIKLVEANGIRTIRGTEIMTLQAVEQFVLYTGVRPAPELIAAAQAHSRAE